MMIQFNLQRFLKLARWSLTMDRRWFVKNTLAWAVVLTLMFLFFTCVMKMNGQVATLASYQACTFMVVCTTIALFVLGPTMMFNSMRGKHDDQRLLMLPASNLEKYLVRYSYWLLLFPCFFASFVVADLLQFLVNGMLGHEGRMLVMQYLADGVTDFHWQDDIPRPLGVDIEITIVWLHSFYAVGTTFFRSHKYSWILTSVALIVLGIILGSLWPKGYFLVIGIVFNFWLSYWLFCRQQVIGKYVNV